MPTLSGLSTNFFPTPNEGFTTTTSGPVDSSSATEVPLNSVSGLTNGAIFTGLIDPGNAKERAFTGVIDTGGSQITSVVFTTGTNATHTTGATVVDYVTGTHVGAMTKGILIAHEQTGVHKAGLVLPTPKITTSINDANGNEVIKTPATSSAVNEITVTNAATGNKPEISATGGDTNVGIKISPKGTGEIELNGNIALTESAGRYTRSRNLLMNGNMNVWQRNTSATPNDDVYSGADRWNFLTETNGAWTVARDTDVPDGSQYSMKCTNVTLNNQMAIVQFLEEKDTKPLDNGYVSLSFWAKTSGTEIANLRAAILTWGSTADSVTSDVIGTWAQDGTNPTWATNWTLESTPANLALTGTWTKYTVENVLLDTATVNNLAVVIWVDDGTIAVNDDFWVTQVQLVAGTKASAFEQRPYTEEFALCQRYYQDMSVADSAYRVYHSNVHRLCVPLPVTMRIAPTCTHTLTGSGIQADNTSAQPYYINYDTQFTGGGAGVIDASFTVLNFDAEL